MVTTLKRAGPRLNQANHRAEPTQAEPARNGLGGGRAPEPGAALKRTLSKKSKNYLNFSIRLGYHGRDHMEATD